VIRPARAAERSLPSLSSSAGPDPADLLETVGDTDGLLAKLHIF
jgi:hypothetical protein